MDFLEVVGAFVADFPSKGGSFSSEEAVGGGDSEHVTGIACADWLSLATESVGDTAS